MGPSHARYQSGRSCGSVVSVSRHRPSACHTLCANPPQAPSQQPTGALHTREVRDTCHTQSGLCTFIDYSEIKATLKRKGRHAFQTLSNDI